MEMEGGEGTGGGGGGCLDFTYLRCAILALEPPDCILSLARQSGGGYLTVEVQNFILEQCIQSSASLQFCSQSYVFQSGNQEMEGYNELSYKKSILKKIIVTAELNHEEVVEGIYEQYAYCISLLKDIEANQSVIKKISFLFGNRSKQNYSKSRNYITPIRCSLNMLEGDTGCAIWPSSLFLSEFILSYPGIFIKKSCFELGSGVGLVGIALVKVNASKVVLSDGDLSSLSNLKFNLKLNQLDGENQVHCKYLPWESANEVEFKSTQPEIILGADVIYNPACISHLIRVIAIFFMRKAPFVCEGNAKECDSYDSGGIGSSSSNNCNPSCTKSNCARKSWAIPVAYIATVIRNVDTFNYFLKLAGEANLSVTDITESCKPLDFLPYMLSYDRASVRLYKVCASPS